MPLSGRARPLTLFALRAGSLAALLSSCAPRALPLTPEHPAHPDAEPGRLAGPPPALRPGVVKLEPPAPAAPAPGEAAPAAPSPSDAPAPSHDPHQGHH